MHSATQTRTPLPPTRHRSHILRQLVPECGKVTVHAVRRARVDNLVGLEGPEGRGIGGGCGVGHLQVLIASND